MREHYKSQPLTRYPLPIFLLDKPVEDLNSDSQDFQEQYVKAIKDSQVSMDDFVRGEQSYVVEQSQNLGPNPKGNQIDEWKQKINSRREAAKEEAEKRINGIYDDLEKLGFDYPEQQDKILITSEFVLNFVFKTFDNLQEFLTDIVRKIYDYLKNLLNTIKVFFQKTFVKIRFFFGDLFTQTRLLNYYSSCNSTKDTTIKWDNRESTIDGVLKYILLEKPSSNLTIIFTGLYQNDWDEALESKEKLSQYEQLENPIINITQELLSGSFKYALLLSATSLMGLALWFGTTISATKDTDGSWSFVLNGGSSKVLV